MTVDMLGTSVEGYQSGGTSKTVSFTLAAGQNRILIAFGFLSKVGTKLRDTESITYNGVGMTEIVGTIASANNGAAVNLFYMLEADLPADGAHNAVATISSGDTAQSGIHIMCFENCVQQAPTLTDSEATHGVAQITTCTVSGIKSNSAVLSGASAYGTGEPYTIETGFSLIHSGFPGVSSWRQVGIDQDVVNTSMSSNWSPCSVLAVLEGVGGGGAMPIFY